MGEREKGARQVLVMGGTDDDAVHRRVGHGGLVTAIGRDPAELGPVRRRTSQIAAREGEGDRAVKCPRGGGMTAGDPPASEHRQAEGLHTRIVARALLQDARDLPPRRARPCAVGIPFLGWLAYAGGAMGSRRILGGGRTEGPK